MSHTVAIEIKAASKAGYLPISGKTHFFAGEDYAFQFSNDSKNNAMLGSNVAGKRHQNPVIIKGLTQSELKQITSLESKVVVVPNSKFGRM